MRRTHRTASGRFSLSLFPFFFFVCCNDSRCSKGGFTLYDSCKQSKQLPTVLMQHLPEQYNNLSQSRIHKELHRPACTTFLSLHKSDSFHFSNAPPPPPTSCALRHGIRISMEAILACHRALSENDWTGWQNGVDDDVCAQTPMLFFCFVLFLFYKRAGRLF